MEQDAEIKAPFIAHPPRRVPALVWVPIVFGGVVWQVIWLFLIMMLVSFSSLVLAGDHHSNGAQFTQITAANVRQATDATSQQIDLSLLWPFLFPLGLSLLSAIGLWQGIRRVLLLRTGIVVDGMLINTFITKTSSNNSSRITYTYYHTFLFTDADGRLRTAVEQTNSEEDWPYSDQRVTIFYNPSVTGHTLVLRQRLDTEPFTFDAQGNLRATSAKGLLTLLLPFIYFTSLALFVLILARSMVEG
ncbi:MAG: hypothetical protein WCJ56_03295 [bacterium]